MKKVLAASAALVLTGGVAAQGVITDGSSRFEWNSFSTSTGTGASTDFQFDATDQQFGMGLWGRADGQSREFNFATPTTQNYTGNTATHTYADLIGVAGLSARVVSVLTEVAAGAALMIQDISITNDTGNDLGMSLFHYVDFDVNGTAGGDSAILESPNVIAISDGGVTARYAGVNASAYQVTPFAALRTLLSNTNIDNLDNSGLPFGPGDFTGGFQWRLQIAAGDTAVVRVIQTLNAPVPAPGALALLGAAGLVARRRRRA